MILFPFKFQKMSNASYQIEHLFSVDMKFAFAQLYKMISFCNSTFITPIYEINDLWSYGVWYCYNLCNLNRKGHFFILVSIFSIVLAAFNTSGEVTINDIKNALPEGVSLPPELENVSLPNVDDAKKLFKGMTIIKM